MILALALGLIIIMAVGHSAEISTEPRALPPPEPEFIPAGPTAIDLERKRIIVQKGFMAAEAKRRAFVTAKRVAESPEQTKNTVAAYFTQLRIPLTKPDPRDPFWNKSEKQIADFVAAAVNRFLNPAKTATGYHASRGGRVISY